MVAQALNRDFMLAVAATTRRQVERIAANRKAGIVGQAGDPMEISVGELGEIADALAELLELEQRQAPTVAPARLGEGAPPAKHDYAYMPREPLMGMLQSTFESHVVAHVGTDERRMPDDRRGGPLPAVTDTRIAGTTLTLAAEGRRLWRRMEIAHPKILSDPRWVRSVWSMTKRRLHGPAPFVARPGAPPPLADDARIVIVGDWGSGLPRARAVASRIRAQLDDPAAGRMQKHVVHLGDVYYGGERDEYLRNFLDPWPVAPGRADVASYTLNGNHDMYAGGQHYYGTALADPRFAAQEGSSMFALANDHWQLLALDTAYEDGGLHGDQAAWVREQRRAHPGRKTVLLSHHQLFSAYEAGATTLRRKIAPVLKEAPIDAWFWGHEHRCLAYRDHENVRFASCVGHGGVPEYLAEEGLVRPEGLVYEYRVPYSTGWQPWITFGFVVLDLHGPQAHVRYVDEHGNEHWSSPLP